MFTGRAPAPWIPGVGEEPAQPRPQRPPPYQPGERGPPFGIRQPLWRKNGPETIYAHWKRLSNSVRAGFHSTASAPMADSMARPRRW